MTKTRTGRPTPEQRAAARQAKEQAELEAWIAEQRKHFQPGDMAPFVRIMRASRVRRLREAAQAARVGGAA